jgi:hypothetical protein
MNTTSNSIKPGGPIKGRLARLAWYSTATPADRREYGKWARCVSVFYGLLVLTGIGFALIHEHQSPRNAVARRAGSRRNLAMTLR